MRSVPYKQANQSQTSLEADYNEVPRWTSAIRLHSIAFRRQGRLSSSSVKNMAATNCVSFIKTTFSKDQFNIWQCDNGRHLKCKAVKKTIENLGGKMVNSAPYHPQSNGGVERQNGTIKAAANLAVSHLDRLSPKLMPEDTQRLRCPLFWPKLWPFLQRTTLLLRSFCDLTKKNERRR